MSEMLRILLVADNPDARALAIQELRREFPRLEVVQIIEGSGSSETLEGVGQLLAGLAHNLNNPLAVILGHVAILQQALANSSHVERLEKIERAADRCVQIVNDFSRVARRPPVPQLPSAVRGKRILVVDDEPEIAAVLVEVLQLDGHAVETVSNGEAALGKLAVEAYDVILSDIHMPDMDGPTLYREIELRHRYLLQRFIFLTGDVMSPEISQFLEEIGVPYLRKPFTLDMVREVVQRALVEESHQA
jgi:CheY-like chemotaxis protein